MGNRMGTLSVDKHHFQKAYYNLEGLRVECRMLKRMHLEARPAWEPFATRPSESIFLCCNNNVCVFSSRMKKMEKGSGCRRHTRIREEKV